MTKKKNPSKPFRKGAKTNAIDYKLISTGDCDTITLEQYKRDREAEKVTEGNPLTKPRRRA